MMIVSWITQRRAQPELDFKEIRNFKQVVQQQIYVGWADDRLHEFALQNILVFQCQRHRQAWAPARVAQQPQKL